MITFYFHHTPNPMKVALMLEETGLPYEARAVDVLKGDQHSPAYRAINPNGKAPAIVDDGRPVFDSNAILLWLGEKSGQFLGPAAERHQLLSWLMFVASGLGPYSGQAVHFTHVHTDSAYATERYRFEVERHYTVLEERLKVSPFIAGPEYTIVDIAAWGWIDRAGRVLNDARALERWPTLKAWFEGVEARPAVPRARAVGQHLSFKKDMDEEARRAMFPGLFTGSAA